MFRANFGDSLSEFAQGLPEDLEAWVNEGYEDL